MEKYLYEDLYNLEETHFWHVGKREVARMLIEKYLVAHIRNFLDPQLPSASSGQARRIFTLSEVEGRSAKISYARLYTCITRMKNYFSPYRPQVKNPKILDIGCGTGRNLTMLNQFGDAWGIDVSPEAIKFCIRRKLTQVRLGSAEKTGFGKNSFDLITMFDCLEHTDEQNSLNEVNRVLKPGGHLLLTVPAYQWLWSRWDEVLGHRKRYEKPRIEKQLGRYGFKIIKSSYFFSYLLLPVAMTRLIKQLLHKRNYGSDFSVNNRFINQVGKLLNRIEQLIISKIQLPFGTSIIVLARKI